ncbi:DUF389 domain-containing protein [Cesiribacter sp. SM1]|uniref:DUF389 domain-containing protein n=1 Tax=Cesiribacter sp. SM1 TaxID=2861196 RepID=UPI001CD2E31C|nr:DUF389 domain-containing protein [Cesiribacter sp. SM1]
MRQLILKVPQGHKERINKAISEHQGKNTIKFENQEHDVFIIFLPNNNIDDFLRSIGEIDEREISLIPRGVITLYPPESEAPDQVADVRAKSSFEIYLGGIQSVGSMFGLIGYSFVAGMIVWIGLVTNTSYLLVAAMLVAPFAGPAMNAALATASGKTPLLKSSLKRYGLAILIGVTASFLMTMIFSLQSFTSMMIGVSHVSKYAVFLPLISGFAGAVNVCQSERDSLVSGAAVGILVAASLAPPVGLVGIGLYLMDAEIISSSVFTIILQLLGIHLSATMVFYFYGKVTPGGIRFLNGKKSILISTCLLAVLAIGAMMYWQFSNPPYLQKSSISTELTQELESKLKNIDNIEVISKSASFTNTTLHGKPVVYIQTTVLSKDTTLAEQSLKRTVKQYLEDNLDFRDESIHKIYQITVLEE